MLTRGCQNLRSYYGVTSCDILFGKMSGRQGTWQDVFMPLLFITGGGSPWVPLTPTCARATASWRSSLQDLLCRTIAVWTRRKAESSLDQPVRPRPKQYRLAQNQRTLREYFFRVSEASSGRGPVVSP